MALQEAVKDRRAAEGRVEGQAGEEALEGVCSSEHEVRAEAVPADVFHALLVGEGRNGSGGEVFGELFPEEDKVGEAAADGG